MLKVTGDVCEDGVLPVVLTFFGFMAAFLLSANFIWVKKQSKHIYENAWGQYFEDIFITPFVPSSFEVFVVFIYIFSFSQTVTMYFTRAEKGYWEGAFTAQQTIPNVVAQLFGCKPFNDGSTSYLQYPKNGTAPSGQNKYAYNADIDWAIGIHISCGLLWLTMGAIQ